MGLLDNLRESYQTKLNQRRIESGLPPLKFGDRKLTAWEKEKAKRINLPLVLDTEDKVKVYRLNKEGRNKVKRYQHVFKNSPKIMKMYIDKMTSASTQEELIEANNFLKDKKNIQLYANKEDFTRWSDLMHYGDGRWDMIYRRDSDAGKKAYRKYINHPIMQIQHGPAVGLYNAYAGTAELVAALSDVTGLTDDAIGKVEKALPAIDLMEVYGDSRGSIAKMTSVLVQYGLGFGVARQIA